MDTFGPDEVEWIDDDIRFPSDAPAAFADRAIRIGWHHSLKRVVVNFQGVAPSAEDVAWAEAWISNVAELIGIDPSTRAVLPPIVTN